MHKEHTKDRQPWIESGESLIREAEGLKIQEKEAEDKIGQKLGAGLKSAEFRGTSWCNVCLWCKC